jgi:protocatechuate 3,4-dioxygenase beta subunit
VAAAAPLPAKAWIQGALIALGLLVLPLVAWFAFPSGGPVSGAESASAPMTTPTSDAPVDVPDEIAGARKLSGHVVDETGKGVAGATVIAESPGHPPHETTTRSDGAFSLDAAPSPGTLTARATGFAIARLAVQAGGDVAALELRLHAASPVSGIVVDASGKPVAGAFVECEGAGDTSATTDEAGHFELAAAADGCRATATHADFGTSPPVDLVAGDRNRIEMPSPGAISGTVSDEQGRPVTRYLLSIESFTPALGVATTPWGRHERVEEAGGAFTLDNLSAGKYVLVASAEGRPPAKSEPVEVESGRTASGVRITLGKGGTLSGVVTDRTTQKPIAGVRVRLDAVTSSGPSAVAPSITDESGHYAIDGVPNGPFSIRVTHKDYTDRIVSLDASNDHDLHQDIDLAPGGDGPSTEMTGIGATLAMGSRYVEVASVLDGGPAAAAGLQSGDLIERIDGTSAEGFSVADCVQRLRGPEGTRVTVTLGRGAATVEITITRAKIVR